MKALAKFMAKSDMKMPVKDEEDDPIKEHESDDMGGIKDLLGKEGMRAGQKPEMSDDARRLFGDDDEEMDY